MMIGDNDVNRKLGGPPHHFGGADAGIDADDQPDTAGGRGFHHLRTHPVAILEAMRHMIIGRAPGHLDRLGEQHHAGCAIHVIVAVDDDLLPIGDGFGDALRSAVHAAQQ